MTWTEQSIRKMVQAGLWLTNKMKYSSGRTVLIQGVGVKNDTRFQISPLKKKTFVIMYIIWEEKKLMKARGTMFVSFRREKK